MSKAKLFDGKKPIEFILPPETIKRSLSGTYTSLNVLDTKNPLVRRKFSATTLDLGRILLISPGLTIDQYPTINTLTYWAENQNKLSFNFNTYSIPVCYISNLTTTIKQWYKNRPVHVEMDITLIEASVEAKATVKPAAKKITPREQDKAKAKVKDRLKTPAKRLALGLSPNYEVLVSDLSLVQFSDGETVKEYDYDTLMELTA